MIFWEFGSMVRKGKNNEGFLFPKNALKLLGAGAWAVSSRGAA